MAPESQPATANGPRPMATPIMQAFGSSRATLGDGTASGTEWGSDLPESNQGNGLARSSAGNLRAGS